MSQWVTAARRRLQKDKTFFASLVFVALVAVLLLVFTDGAFWHRVGEALVIAVVLAVTVDLHLKSRLAKEVARDISPYLMAYNIPGALREEVAEICKIECYRYAFKLGYELKEIPSHPDLLEVKTTLEYRLENLTDRYLPYCHMMWVEKTERADIRIAQIGPVGAEGVRDERREPLSYSNGEGGTVTSIAGGVQWSRNILIPPKGVSTSRLWQSNRQVFPLEHYESFLTTVPVVGAEVDVRKPRWIDVSVGFEHRLEARVKHRELDDTHSVWEFEPALLPFSTISLVWRPFPKE